MYINLRKTGRVKKRDLLLIFKLVNGVKILGSKKHACL